MALSNLERKTVAMYTNILNVYRREGEKEETCKEELRGDFIEDMTAALMALYIFWQEVTGEEDDEEDDIVGFTHILNRLAIQYVLEEREKKWMEEDGQISKGKFS